MIYLSINEIERELNIFFKVIFKQKLKKMNAQNLILCVLAISLSFVANAQIRAVAGIHIDGGYKHINSPEDSNYDFKKSGGAWGISLGPKVDIGNTNVRLTIEGHGTYMSNKNIVTLFLKDDYKARRSLGYGGSAIFYCTPWEFEDATTTLQVGSNVRQSKDTKHGFSVGGGWEDMETFYKIPKDSDKENKRFAVFYGQVGYGFFSSLNNIDFYFRYGVGEYKASMWGIGMNIGFNF